MDDGKKTSLSPDLIDPSALLAADEKGDLPASASRGSEEPAEEPYTDDDLIDEADQSYEDGIDSVMDLPEDSFLSLKQDTILNKIEDTRSRLALVFTILTFIIFIFGMVLATIDGIVREVSIIENLKEIIPLVSSVFLGTLGFVLGYYFRKGDEE